MTRKVEFTLSEREALELAEHVAALAEANLPLDEGLRAAADDIPSRRLAIAFRALANEVSTGRPLAEVFSDAKRVPPYLAGLVAAGLRTGHLPSILRELVSLRRATRELWRGVLTTLAYPAVLFVLLFLLVMLVVVAVVPPHAEMMKEFQIKIPYTTQVLFAIAQAIQTVIEHWLIVAGGAFALLLVVFLVGKFVLGGATCSRIATQVPIVGPMWQWLGAVDFCRLLALLLEGELPLPVALRLTAGALRDPNYRDACYRVADDVESGATLSLALATVPGVPRLIAPLVHWGESGNQLVAALRTTADILADRAALRADLLKVVLPPFMFLVVAVVASNLVQGLFMPLVSLTENLAK